jgi:hypothetical protein
MDFLKTLVDKLSQYNLLTNILPGTVLCVLLKYIDGMNFVIASDWYLAGIVFYFVGIVNNRFSSLVVEPLLKTKGFVKFAKYEEFVKAEKQDPKITILSNENNVFRAYISVIILTVFFYAYQRWLSTLAFFSNNGGLILLILLCALFVFSYKKQTKYVVKRVNENNKKQI